MSILRRRCWLLLLMVVGCAEAPAERSGPVDAGSIGSSDAGSDGPSDASTDVSAPNHATELEATINGVRRTLSRAQYGAMAERVETFHIEAHEGGVAECPEQGTPDRTLVLSGVPNGRPGDIFTDDDGVAATYFDFAGDQIETANPIRTAIATTVRLVAARAGETVEVEVDAKFEEGRVVGRIYATYCEAMSRP